MQAPDVKITVVGNAGVGKTALIMAYMVRTHSPSMLAPRSMVLAGGATLLVVAGLMCAVLCSELWRASIPSPSIIRTFPGLTVLLQNGVFPVEYLPRQVDREVFPATYRGGTIELEVIDVADSHYHGTRQFPVNARAVASLLQNVDRLRPVYYPGTSVFLICFDVMRRRTLDDALSRVRADNCVVV